MKVFIAIAPVVHCNNIYLDIFHTINRSEKVKNMMKDSGPEILSDPASVHPFQDNLNSVLETTNKMSVLLSDAKPDTVSPIALANYPSHFPAGSSWKSIEHYMQLF